ncbi:MAG TPA: TetR/AcrR family transcriptional regulator [Solirubrobacteraceae bacterium]|nr:TetR/AcrR family transcriptional regulator [Solirubrobacteraceae bacterium]
MSSAGQRGRMREQREQTRREIIAAADRVLRERPYRELSVEAVMSGTGLTRTAFYRHFDDVPDLVLRVLQEVGRELFDIAQNWLKGSADDFPAAAHEALSGVVAFFARHGPLVSAVAEAAVTDERIEAGYRRFIEVFIEVTTQGFDEMVARGQLAPFDTEGLSRALNLMNERFLLDQLGREPRGEPAAVLAVLETVWLRSAGAAAAGSPPAG